MRISSAGPQGERSGRGLNGLKTAEHMLTEYGVGFVRCLLGVVDSNGIERGIQRSLASRGIHRVAGGTDALGVAPTGQSGLPDRFVGLQEELYRGEREDLGSDVTSFHDERAEDGAVTLPGDHPVADLGDLGDDRDGLFDPVGPDLCGWKVAVDVKPGLTVDDPHIRLPASHETHDGEFVGIGHGFLAPESGLEGPPSQGAVHGAGIDVDAAELGCQPAGKGALSRGAGAIDRDDLGETQGAFGPGLERDGLQSACRSAGSSRRPSGTLRTLAPIPSGTAAASFWKKFGNVFFTHDGFLIFSPGTCKPRVAKHIAMR